MNSIFSDRTGSNPLGQFQNENYSNGAGTPAYQEILGWAKKHAGDAVIAAGVIVDVVSAVAAPETAGASLAGEEVGSEMIAAGRAIKGESSIWSATKKLSGVENAFEHWGNHGDEFPEYGNAKQYVEGAHEFFSNSPEGTLMKSRENGDTLFYHPESNTFGVTNSNGVPRTMFRPIEGMDYWLKQ